MNNRKLSNDVQNLSLDKCGEGSSLFVGCEIILKSNEYSTGIIVGKSRRGKNFWRVEWDDGSGITNTFGEHLARRFN
jgi:hypothetical protein